VLGRVCGCPFIDFLFCGNRYYASCSQSNSHIFIHLGPHSFSTTRVYFLSHPTNLSSVTHTHTLLYNCLSHRSPPSHRALASPSAPIMSTTSYTSRHSRVHSPPLSVTATSTVGPQSQRLNIVTRLAIEGNAKKTESVPIKMYMKVCHVPELCFLILISYFTVKLALPLDSITPGSAIPLFKGLYLCITFWVTL
jgi:hypothetical protein